MVQLQISRRTIGVYRANCIYASFMRKRNNNKNDPAEHETGPENWQTRTPEQLERKVQTSVQIITTSFSGGFIFWGVLGPHLRCLRARRCGHRSRVVLCGAPRRLRQPARGMVHARRVSAAPPAAPPQVLPSGHTCLGSVGAGSQNTAGAQAG